MEDALGFPPGTTAVMISGNNELWFYPPGKGPQEAWPSVTRCDLCRNPPWPDAEEIETCREVLRAGEPVIFVFATAREAIDAYSGIHWFYRSV
jgi:hypothetical protein